MRKPIYSFFNNRPMKQFYILCISFCMASSWVSAQDEAIFNHYYLNPILVNPATAGFSGNHNFMLNARASWTGFPDAPQTVGFQYNGPLGPSFGIGVGGVTETAAQLSRIKGRLNFAFRFDVANGIECSTGFATEFQNVRLNSNVLDSKIIQLGDRVIANGIDGFKEFDASLAAYCRLYENSYIGLSFTNLVRARLDGVSTPSDENNLFKYYIIHAGHKFEAGNGFSIEPSMLARQLRGTSPQVDVNLRAGFLDEQLSAGLSYRSIGGMGLLLGARLNSLEIYYSYDLSFNRIQSYNQGSHEILLAVSLKALNADRNRLRKY